MELNLIKNYNKIKHQEMLGSNKLHINYMYTKKWDNEKHIPYVLKTHLLDSYYCLPERPDMAFTFLWKCINNTYSTYQIRESTEVLKGDSKLLEFMSENIVKKLNNSISYDGVKYEIKDLIKMYIENIPNKLLSFVSNYILKSYVIEKQLKDERYISSSYNTFRKKFKNIHNIITLNYGENYLKLCNPCINNGEINLNISDEKKGEEIIKSLTKKLKELIIRGETVLTHNGKNDTLKLQNDTEYIQFILFNILYAIRNNTVHGKIASRLNSNYLNGKSFRSSKYTYLLGYMFLSIMLYISDELVLNDLSFNFKNIRYLK